MLLKLIACNVFMREACLCVARTPHVVDVEFTELGMHVHSGMLREDIQRRIDTAAAPGKTYDAILLLFGLCGNAGVELHARNAPLVMPRAHDCCTILLGSRGRFREHFQSAPSTPFSSAGYLERGEYFMRMDGGEAVLGFGDSFAACVEQYGEENARYVWEMLHPARAEEKRAVFIDLPETAHLGHAERFREKAEADGREYVRIEGSLRLVQGLLEGDWNPEDYLLVPPGSKTRGVYDWDEIVRAAPQEP